MGVPTRASRRASLTAGSPYFTSFVDHELLQLKTLSDALTDIAAHAKRFSESGGAMAKSARDLARACRLSPNPSESTPTEAQSIDHPDPAVERAARSDAVGQELGIVLSTLAEVSQEECVSLLCFSSNC